MNRGDIYTVDLEPTVGRQQRGHRPVLVVSPTKFNQHNAPLICPISSGAVAQRVLGLTVSLATAGTRTTGVVVCSQIRTVDLRARHARRVEAAPSEIIDDVLAKLQAILA